MRSLRLEVRVLLGTISLLKLKIIINYGEVAERTKALVLKTSEEQSSVGSNPSLSEMSEANEGEE